MGEIVVLSSDDGMETIKNRGKSSEVVQWEKYLPKTELRVLLVESDDSTRQIITSLLRKCCYKVVAVPDGLAAWETLKEKSHSIDLILTELDLPSISGFALLALVMEHEACKNIPVIMMSSQDSITMVLKCMLRGAADYLIKPMRKNELKNLWQHVWRRLSLRNDPTSHAHSLPASQQNLEDTDETSADSRYHSDRRSGAQASSYNSQKKLAEDARSLDEGDGFKYTGSIDQKLETCDVTMDLIGGIDKRECLYGNKTREQKVGPELELSLKRSYSGSLEKQYENKHQKLSFYDESAFLRYENSKPGEKGGEASSSGDPKTPNESHEKLRCDQGSATTSSNQENIGSSSISGQCGQNELSLQNQVQDSTFPVETNRLKARKEIAVGCQSICNNEKRKEEGSLNVQERWSQREAALMKFRMKRKDRCFDKKVRYQSRKKLAERRPRVRGQFVRAVNSEASTKA